MLFVLAQLVAALAAESTDMRLRKILLLLEVLDRVIMLI